MSLRQMVTAIHSIINCIHARIETLTCFLNGLAMTGIKKLVMTNERIWVNVRERW